MRPRGRSDEIQGDYAMSTRISARVRAGWSKGFVAVCLIVFASYGTAGTVAPPPVAAASVYINELIVELDPVVLGTSITAVANDIVTAGPASFASRFGEPTYALPLMNLRYSAEAASLLQSDDPILHLQNSVILYFPDD